MVLLHPRIFARHLFLRRLSGRGSLALNLLRRVQVLFVPLFQYPVAIRPLELVTLEHGLVIGNRDRFGRKAHFQPAFDVLFLARRGCACRHLQRRHIVRIQPAPALLLFQKFVHRLHGKQLPARPGVAFLLDLAHRGAPSGAETRLLAGDAVVHQKIDHVTRKTQILIELQQYFEACRRKRTESPLHLAQQLRERLVALHAPHNVLLRVLRRLLRRKRRLLPRFLFGQPDQLRPGKGGFRRVKPQLLPRKRFPQLFFVHRVPVLLQTQIQQARICVFCSGQAAQNRRGQHDILFFRQVQNHSCHDAASFLSNQLLFYTNFSLS